MEGNQPDKKAYNLSDYINSRKYKQIYMLDGQVECRRMSGRGSRKRSQGAEGSPLGVKYIDTLSEFYPVVSWVHTSIYVKLYTLNKYSYCMSTVLQKSF
jgi:hypothetical protein